MRPTRNRGTIVLKSEFMAAMKRIALILLFCVCEYCDSYLLHAPFNNPWIRSAKISTRNLPCCKRNSAASVVMTISRKQLILAGIGALTFNDIEATAASNSPDLRGKIAVSALCSVEKIGLSEN